MRLVKLPSGRIVDVHSVKDIILPVKHFNNRASQAIIDGVLTDVINADAAVLYAYVCDSITPEQTVRECVAGVVDDIIPRLGVAESYLTNGMADGTLRILRKIQAEYAEYVTEAVEINTQPSAPQPDTPAPSEHRQAH